MTSTAIARSARSVEQSESRPLALPTMRAVVDYQVLTDAVSAAARIVPTKSTLPIAACVLLEASASSASLDVTGTNLHTEVTHQVPAEVRRAGRVAVSARVLSEYLDALAGEADRVLLATSPVRPCLHMVCGRFRARLNTPPADEFPRLERPSTVVERSVDGQLLEQLAARTVFASLDRSPDRALGNVLVDMGDGQLSLVGADGFRLARAAARIQWDRQDVFALLIPKDAAEELGVLLGRARAKKSEPGRLRLAVDVDRQVVEAGADAFHMVIRARQHEFPDYHSLLEVHNHGGVQPAARVVRLQLQEAVATQAVFSGTGGQLEVAFCPPGELQFSAKRETGDTQSSDARAKLEAEVSGPPDRVPVDGKQLREALAALESDRVELRATKSALVLIDRAGIQHALVRRGTDEH